MVDRVKGGGRAHPILTILGWFYHHDGMSARHWPLPHVYSVAGPAGKWTSRKELPRPPPPPQPSRHFWDEDKSRQLRPAPVLLPVTALARASETAWVPKSTSSSVMMVDWAQLLYTSSWKQLVAEQLQLEKPYRTLFQASITVKIMPPPPLFYSYAVQDADQGQYSSSVKGVWPG